MLKLILDDKKLNFLETKPLSLECDCSKQRLERVLKSLGRVVGWIAQAL